MSTTIVTSLYDIDRGQLQGEFAKRSFDIYLERFKHVLSLNIPMVVFIPKKLEQYVLIYRNDYPSKIIIREFKELAAYKYYDKIQNVLNNIDDSIVKDYKKYPEFLTAKYETIIFSKFDFLQEVANNNPFKTEYFMWLDAGTFYTKPSFDKFDRYKLRIIDNKFLIPNINLDIHNKICNKKEYLRHHDNKICCYFIGGTKDIISKVCKDFWNEVDNAIELNIINNEQIILQLVIQQHPEDYFLWSTQHYKYDLLESPTKNRMIPYELSLGTFMTQKYHVNPNIKLLTIATKEINPKHYYKWETSAKYYGYNYEIIGKDTKWSGFNTKIKLCIDNLKKVKEEYTLITDCTDVFFCGSSDELYDKLISSKKDVLVGTELKIWYNGGKYSHNDLYKYFNDIKESEQKFPNGGFIVGKTKELIKVMELISEYKDDQVGYFDIVYDKRYHLSLDYETTLVGNIPNYKDHTLSPNYFIYDENLNRFKNRYNDETPIALHFPGSNFYYMQEFYNIVNSDLETNSLQGEYLAMFFIILFIFIILILIIYYLF